VYAKLEFEGAQMMRIRAGLEKGLDVSSYAKPGFSWEKMDAILEDLEEDLAENRWKKFCKGFESEEALADEMLSKFRSHRASPPEKTVGKMDKF
jgi:hypothetical protein